MNKRDALKLRPGDLILFGNDRLTLNCTEWGEGEVIHVTDKGGILVRIVEGCKRSGGGWDWSGPWTGPDVGKERWVRYDHVSDRRGRIEDLPPRPS